MSGRPQVIESVHGPATLGILGQGDFGGSAALKLLNNNMDPKVLRTNATLRYEEWQEIDRAVVEAARDRLMGVNDLTSRGLTYPLANGLGTTVLAWEDVSDMEAAELTMDGATRAEEDRVEFGIKYLPIPIISKPFRINIRQLYASRQIGAPLDTTQVSIATTKVVEMAEQILFQGASSFSFGGHTLYGYQDYTNRVTRSLGTAWDDSGSTPIADARNMLADAAAVKHYGPFILYTPRNWVAAMEDDYNATYPTSITVRERIRKIDGIEDVKTADFLSDDNAVLVQMRPETARVIVGMQPTPVEWTTEGGMILHYKVMAILVPQIRADQANNCGIVHLS